MLAIGNFLQKNGMKKEVSSPGNQRDPNAFASQKRENSCIFFRVFLSDREKTQKNLEMAEKMST